MIAGPSPDAVRLRVVANPRSASAISLSPTRPGLVEGHASLFNQRDGAGDVVMAGAFARSLLKRGVGGVRMLFQHDPKEVIGHWTSMVETERGLFVQGQLSQETQRGRELSALVASRAIDGLSIGFRTVSAQRDKARGVRCLYAIDLWEISLVTFPMLESARVSLPPRQTA